MLRSPWRGARPQRPYPATQRFWSSDGMDTRLPSKARTASRAPWSEGWMGPFDGDGADNFWNPKIRGPVCYSPPAAKDQYLTDDEPSLGGSPDVLHPVYGRCCLGCRSAQVSRHAESTVQWRSGTNRRVHGSHPQVV